MYWLDTTLLVALGIGAALGFWSGLLWQIARVAGLALAGYATIFLHEPATAFIHEYLLKDADPGLIQAGAYLVVFLLVYLTCFMITRLLRFWIRTTELDGMDRMLGAILGAAKVAVIVAGGCLLLRNSNNPAAQEWMGRSSLAPAFAQGMEKGIVLIPEGYRNQVLDSFNQFRDSLAKNELQTRE